MQFWSFYFLGKLFLYFMGSIRFNFLMNILFAVLLALPIPERMPAFRVLKYIRVLAAIPLCFLLFWHETWFPPLGYAFHNLTGANAMSAGYMFQFVFQNLNPVDIGGLIALFILCRFASKRFSMAIPVVLLMLVIMPFRACGVRQAVAAQAPPAASGTPQGYFESFHRAEAKRIVRFTKPKKGAPPFDIVVLHI